MTWNKIQAKSIRPNIECTNGIIHLVDTVLIDDSPPWVVGAAQGLRPRTAILPLAAVLVALLRQ